MGNLRESSNQLRPFQFLSQNLEQLRFECDAIKRQKLQTAFRNVLARMDQYFDKNQLYDAVNYDVVVQDLLHSPTFHFGIIPHSQDEVKGFYDPRRNLLAMNANYLDKGTQTEGMLCHEFIHYLTLGQKKFIFKENNQMQEVLMRSSGNNGYALLLNGTEEPTIYSRFRVDAKFIWEGWTEWLKQQIYSPQESLQIYMPCIQMLDFWNALTNQRSNLVDFLRFNFRHLVNFLGDDYDKLCDASVRYDQKLLAMSSEQYQKYDWRHNADYFAMQDLVCQKVLQKTRQRIKDCQVSDFSYLSKVILNYAPAFAANGQRGDYYQTEIAKLGIALSKQKLSETTANSQNNQKNLEN